jgi:hypothetical protein
MNQYIELLTLLLQNAVIANFEYWSEFIIRIQRDAATNDPTLQAWFGELRIPPLFCLRLRSKWWIGEEQNWEMLVRQFPIKGVSPISVEAPLQASTLLMMLENRISAVRVNEKSDLTLVLSDGRLLTAVGTGGEWEESWFLELPVDDPDRDKWSIVCDSQGSIGGRFPKPTDTR